MLQFWLPLLEEQDGHRFFTEHPHVFEETGIQLKLLAQDVGYFLHYPSSQLQKNDLQGAVLQIKSKGSLAEVLSVWYSEGPGE